MIIEYNMDYHYFTEQQYQREHDIDDDSEIEEEYIFNLSGTTKKLKCKICQKTMNIYMPLTIEEKIVCFFCCIDILRIAKKFEFIRISKNEHKNKFENILEDIKELGMNPNRIQQTQLYCYNWKF